MRPLLRVKKRFEADVQRNDVNGGPSRSAVIMYTSVGCRLETTFSL